MKRKMWEDEWRLRSPNLPYLKKRKRKKKRRSDFDTLSIVKEIFKYTFQCVLTRINLINSLRNRNINTTLTSILKLKNRNSNSCLFSFLLSFLLRVTNRGRNLFKNWTNEIIPAQLIARNTLQIDYQTRCKHDR